MTQITYAENAETIKTEMPLLYVTDNYMSLAARGLLTMCWIFCEKGSYMTVSDVAELTGEFPGKVKSVLRELEHLGYVKKIYLRDNLGRFRGIRYQIEAHPRKRTTDFMRFIVSKFQS